MTKLPITSVLLLSILQVIFAGDYGLWSSEVIGETTNPLRRSSPAVSTLRPAVLPTNDVNLGAELPVRFHLY